MFLLCSLVLGFCLLVLILQGMYIINSQICNHMQNSCYILKKQVDVFDKGTQGGVD